MDERHSLLRRQIRKAFGDPGLVPAEWRPFLDVVDEAYRQFDHDRAMVERSLELSSQELLQANRDIKQALSVLSATLESTADGLLVVDHAGKIVSFNRKFLDMWGIPTTAA